MINKLIRRIRRRGEDGERGAILVMATVGVVLAVISTSLAVDLGRIAQERRRDQRVADLAALDAVRSISGGSLAIQNAASASALSNKFPTGSDYSVTAVQGTKTNGTTCTASITAGSVCVRVQSVVKNAFRPGASTIVATAQAAIVPKGGFMIGSSLVTVDTSRASILNNFIGRMITRPGTNLSLSLVSWQGLASTHITLDALRTQLVNLGVSAGDVNSLLTSNITLVKLFQATAAALTNQGDIANATIFNNLALAVTNTATFNLGQFMHVSQGADNTALSSELNVFQLLTAAAELANGNSFIDVNNVGITVPNTTSTHAKLQVIQPPQYYFGPVGGSVSTAQIDLTVSPSLNITNLNLLGLSSIVVTNELSVHITGAGATGTLKSITCGSPGSMVVTVDPTAFAAPVTISNLHIAANVLPIIGSPLAVTVDTPATTSISPAVDGPPVDKTWSYPSQFPPPLGTETTQHVGSQPVGLQSLTNIPAFSSATATVSGLGASLIVSLGLLTPLLNLVHDSLAPVLGAVDTNVVTPLLTALGVDVGSADVTALSMDCVTPGLTG